MNAILAAITEFAKTANTPAGQELITRLLKVFSDHGVPQNQLDKIIQNLPIAQEPKKPESEK